MAQQINIECLIEIDCLIVETESWAVRILRQTLLHALLQGPGRGPGQGGRGLRPLGKQGSNDGGNAAVEQLLT